MGKEKIVETEHVKKRRHQAMKNGEWSARRCGEREEAKRARQGDEDAGGFDGSMSFIGVGARSGGGGQWSKKKLYELAKVGALGEIQTIDRLLVLRIT